MPIGIKGYQKGHRSFLTEESKKKIGLSHKGKKQSPEQIAKRVFKLIGQKRTEDSKVNFNREYWLDYLKKICLFGY